MHTSIFAVGALAALALTVTANAAPAGDLHGEGTYRRETLSRYCYANPYDPRCDDAARRHGPKPHSASGRVCEPTIRAAGKRNLIPAFARNSALFAWRREVRAVHGEDYAGWHRARRARIQCAPAGGALTGCVAVATPCRA